MRFTLLTESPTKWRVELVYTPVSVGTVLEKKSNVWDDRGETRKTDLGLGRKF